MLPARAVNPEAGAERRLARRPTGVTVCSRASRRPDRRRARQESRTHRRHSGVPRAMTSRLPGRGAVGPWSSGRPAADAGYRQLWSRAVRRPRKPAVNKGGWVAQKHSTQHKAVALRVLSRPEMPLHTDARETDIRDWVAERKIDGGTAATSAPVSRHYGQPKKAFRKPGVSFRDHFGERLTSVGKVLPRADLRRGSAARAGRLLSEGLRNCDRRREGRCQTPIHSHSIVAGGLPEMS